MTNVIAKSHISNFLYMKNDFPSATSVVTAIYFQNMRGEPISY